MNVPDCEGSVLLIGGRLVCGTLLGGKLLSGICVAGGLIGNSPFSLGSAATYPFGETQEPEKQVDLQKTLVAYLRAHPASHLVVDLHYVVRPLVAVNGGYYTDCPDISPSECGGIKCMPADVPEAERKRLIEAYADTLLQFFPGDRIALICTQKSAYYAVGNRIRPQEDLACNAMFRQCEDWFRNRTGCRVIPTLRFYFQEKKPSGLMFEKEAYQDTADNVKRFVRNQHIRQRPIFRFSMDRVCRYAQNVYKKAFSAFLRTDNAIENLVYSSTPDFLRAHYELLRHAEKLLIPGYRALAQALDQSRDGAELLRDVLLAMDAVISGDYTDPGIRYETLFENRITVRPLLAHLRAYAEAHWPTLLPEQITEGNHGIYFARMQREMSADPAVCACAERITQHLQGDLAVVELPFAADILGSCVSRLNFQYESVELPSSRMVWRNDLFQVFPLFLQDTPVPYDPQMFVPPLILDDRMVQLQLDGGVHRALDTSGAQWVVVDLYMLTANSLFRYDGRLYCDNKKRISRALGAENLLLYNTFSESEIFAQLDVLAAYLKQRYGRRIILIRHKRMEHYLDSEGKIRSFSPQACSQSRERNAYSHRYEAYFARRTHCYDIDIVDQFLADERNLLYLNNLHFEDAFYREVRRLLMKIFSESPWKRHFTAYDNRTRVERLAAMNRDNPGSQVVRALFQKNWLDDCLLKLAPDFVMENAEVFAQLYDRNYPSLRCARRHFRGPGSDAVLTALARL